MADVRKQTWLALVVGLAVLLPWEAVRVSSANSVQLDRVYRYTKPWLLPWRNPSNVIAVLDPKSERLLIVEDAKPVVHVVDWRRRKELRRVDFSWLECPDPPSQYGSWIWAFEFVPSRPWIHMTYCDSEFVLDAALLSVVRQIRDGKEERGWTTFSPGGEYALLVREGKGERYSASLRRLDTWQEVAEWEVPEWKPGGAQFTPDGQYIVARIEEHEPDSTGRYERGELAKLGLAFHRVPTGELASRWMIGTEGGTYPVGPGYQIVGQTPYLVAEGVKGIQGLGLVLWNAWTGEVLRVLHTDLAPCQFGGFSVSLDASLVVACGWDDPGDEMWSQDFVIWNLETGELVYETPKYKSVWGREVYPRFSYDGKYIIVVRERQVDLFEVLPAAR